MSRVAMDVAGPFPLTPRGNKFLLMIIDTCGPKFML
jgi:hypothetical protein